jgi:poly(3-hydroxybutyrate) depolymerase
VFVGASPILDAPCGADTTGTISYGGLQREYELHIPPSSARTPAALVVVLHGGGAQDDPVGMIRDLTRFNARADAEGFLVLYQPASSSIASTGAATRGPADLNRPRARSSGARVARSMRPT